MCASPIILASDTVAGTVTPYHSDKTHGTVISGLIQPKGIIADSDGSLLYAAVGDTGSGSGGVLRFDRGGNKAVFIGGLNGPSALALDQVGNLYVVSTGDKTLTKYNSVGSVINVVASNLVLAEPFLTFDSLGNLYLSETRDVKMYSPNGTGSIFLPAVLNFVSGVAFTRGGRAFVGLQNSGSIIGLTGGGIVPPATPLNFSPGALGFTESDGKLYAACGQTINRYGLDGKTGEIFAGNLKGTRYLAVTG